MHRPHRADERLQIVTDNDDGSGYVFAEAIWCDRRQKLTFETITSDSHRISARELREAIDVALSGLVLYPEK